MFILCIFFQESILHMQITTKLNTPVIPIQCVMTYMYFQSLINIVIENFIFKVFCLHNDFIIHPKSLKYLCCLDPKKGKFSKLRRGIVLKQNKDGSTEMEQSN